MQQLHDLQTKFRTALFDPRETDISEYLFSPGSNYRERLDLHRNNVFGVLLDALRLAYPVVLRLVGDEFFSHAAVEFIRHFPSKDGDLHQFGQEFPSFLGEFQPAAELPYLPDSARLDWAYHEVFFMPTPPSFPVDHLKKIPNSHHDYLKFTLSPACRLIASAFPIHRIWEANQPDIISPDLVNLNEAGIQLLVKRTHLSMQLIPIALADWDFLMLLESNLSLHETSVLVMKNHPEFDLPGSLQRFIADSVLTDFAI